jgi:hypothetical protein
LFVFLLSFPAPELRGLLMVKLAAYSCLQLRLSIVNAPDVGFGVGHYLAGAWNPLT